MEDRERVVMLNNLCYLNIINIILNTVLKIIKIAFSLVLPA